MSEADQMKVPLFIEIGSSIAHPNSLLYLKINRQLSCVLCDISAANQFELLQV